MSQRDQRSRDGVKATVERHHGSRHVVVRGLGIAREHALAEPAGAEPIALQREKCLLGGRVERPKIIVEFERIDDRRRVFETHVIGPEVAVRIDDPARRDSRLERPRFSVEGSE
jgi:hypothetical protein